MSKIELPETPKLPIDSFDKSISIEKPEKSFDFLKENMSFNEYKQKSEEVFQNFTNNYMYIGLLGVFVVGILVAYGLHYIISNKLFNQSSVTIKSTKQPIICNKQGKYPIKEFNKSGNGKRRTYTFWIYIHDLNKYSGSYRHVFHIGDENDVSSASPFVFLDKHENKLYIRFSPSQTSTNINNIQNMNSTQLSDFMKQGIVIPYIPLQRWVHVGIVVNENSNNGTITGYVDGDLSKVISTDETNDFGSKNKISNLNLDKMGDLYTGGSFESSIGPGFSGLISKITMFNYDLNNKDIHNDYNKGPLDGFLASLGLSNYGLQYPIYKLE